MQSTRARSDLLEASIFVGIGTMGFGLLGFTMGHLFTILNQDRLLKPSGLAVGCASAVPLALLTAKVVSFIVAKTRFHEHTDKTFERVFVASVGLYGLGISVLYSIINVNGITLSSLLPCALALMVLGAVSYLEMRRKERSQQLASL